MASNNLNYKKYKWFFTFSGKLVIGGKSAEQNEELLHILKLSKKDYIVMHTSEPGSPFCVILSDIKKITKQDKEECAIFTGCFSRDWRSGKTKSIVDIFHLSHLIKDLKAKPGTWHVVNNIDKIRIPLKLVLTRQRGVLRAVPPITLKNADERLLTILPGKTPKENMATVIAIMLNGKVKLEEIMSSLPSGGVRLLDK